MALTSTMYRFRIALSDVDEGVYESVEMRVARHSSESAPFLVMRVLAYCLNFQEGLAHTQGIGSPDDPAMWVKDLTGTIQLWIDIGNPAARRLHKASKAARRVRVYTHRDPQIIIDETRGAEIHRRGELEVFAVDTKFVDRLGEALERDNQWEILRDEGEITVTFGDKSYSGEIRSVSI